MTVKELIKLLKKCSQDKGIRLSEDRNWYPEPHDPCEMIGVMETEMEVVLYD